MYWAYKTVRSTGFGSQTLTLPLPVHFKTVPLSIKWGYPYHSGEHRNSCIKYLVFTLTCLNFSHLQSTLSKNLRSSKRKGDSYLQRTSHRLSADFSKETLQARRGWQEVFQVMKGKSLHPRLLYPAKLSFRMEGQIKCFSDKVKLKKFIITKPLLYEMLKGVT